MLKGILPLACAFLVTVVPSLTTAQTPLGVVCITKKGAISVRSKCLTGETTATLSNLVKKGPPGNAGAAGPSGAPGREVRFTQRAVAPVDANPKTLSEPCPAGKIAVGGGCYSSSSEVRISQSYPFDGSPNRWECGFEPNFINAQAALFTYAICVDQ